MSNLKINNLSSPNQSEEMRELSESDANKVIGGVAFNAGTYVSLATTPTQLVQAWCCCSRDLALASSILV